MSKWIDFDFVKSKKRFDNGKMKDIVWMQDIYHAPSIDLVRCEECKWDKEVMKPKEVKCIYKHKPDDFCSYGERKESE